MSSMPIVTTMDFGDGVERQLGASTESTLLYGTLLAGETEVTITELPATDSYIADVLTSSGISYTDIDTSVSGSVTLTFEAQSSDTEICIRLEKI